MQIDATTLARALQDIEQELGAIAGPTGYADLSIIVRIRNHRITVVDFVQSRQKSYENLKSVQSYAIRDSNQREEPTG